MYHHLLTVMTDDRVSMIMFLVYARGNFGKQYKLNNNQFFYKKIECFIVGFKTLYSYF